MYFEYQVCSLKLAQKLKKLGVQSPSYFAWWENTRRIVVLGEWTESIPANVFKKNNPIYSAYTVGELGEMMPVYGLMFRSFQTPSKWTVEFGGKDGIMAYTAEDYTEADARAKMLIYLIENNLITP